MALAATVGLVLTACTGESGEDQSAAPDQPTPVASPSPDGTTSPTTSPPAPSPPDEETTPGPLLTVETPDLDHRCEVEPERLPEIERISYAVPSAWRVEGRCDVLDPDLEELPDSTEVDAAIFVNISGGDFERTTEDSPAQRDVTTWLGAHAGFPAVRSTYVGTGEALSEDGQPGTSWSYDLDPGGDDQGGILTLSTSDAGDGAAYTRTQATLDAIAQTLVIQPPASQPASSPGDTEFSVLRVEGGGTPMTVGHDGDCFTLRPGGPGDAVTDRLCDLDPLAGDLVAGMLGEDVVAGYASPLAVAVQSDSVTPPYGLTSAIEGSSVFAFEVDRAPEELTAVGPGGEVLHTAPLR